MDREEIAEIIFNHLCDYGIKDTDNEVLCLTEDIIKEIAKAKIEVAKEIMFIYAQEIGSIPGGSIICNRCKHIINSNTTKE